MKYLYRTYIKNIFCEIAVNDNSKGTIIYCPGLPDLPKESNFMIEISKFGYNVIYLRYRGTYESGGRFLKKSPSKDIKEIINYFTENKYFKELYNLKEIKLTLGKIKLLASSFGAIVAINISKQIKDIDLILVSPLIIIDEDIKKELNRLKIFLKYAYKNVYRFNDKDFDNLKNKLFFSSNDINEVSGSINIFHGINDSIIDINKIRKIVSNKKNIKLTELDSEHMRASSLEINMIKNILKNE